MSTIITQVDGAGALNGTPDDDIIIAQHLNGAGVPGTQILTGGAGNDVIFGDHDELFVDGSTVTGNNTFGTATSIDNIQFWGQRENPDVANSTSVPYTSVLATGDGGVDYFSVTVGAGETITIDLDYGFADNNNGSFDSFISLLDAPGSILASNDDGGNSNGGFGSNSGLNRDSFLTFTNTTGASQVYAIEVSDLAAGGIAAGLTYMLNVSVTNHVQSNFAVFGDDDIDGGAGDDVLYGGEGEDTIDGGTGDDLIEGGFGADAIDGGSGNDTISFTTSTGGTNVSLRTGIGGAFGGGFSSHAVGDTYTNIENIIGSSFGDVLEGNNDANVIDGGDGFDFVSYFFDDAAVNVDLGLGTVSGGSQASGDTLANIEGVSGTNDFGDTLIGNFEVNTLNGVGGDDTLEGRGGNDTLNADAGNDTLDGGDGSDTLNGGDDDDVLRDTGTDNASDVLNGGAGNDILEANFGTDSFDGGTGIDTLQIEGSFAEFFTETGNAIDFDIDLAAGNDTFGNTYVNIENVNGGAGDDTIDGDANDNVLSGGAGDDTLNGGAGDDILSDGSGTDTVNGGAGNDTYRLRAGLNDLNSTGDSVDGGADIDTVEIIGAYNTNAVFDMTAGTYTYSGGTNTVANFENFDASGLLANRTDTYDVTGTSGANTIIGGYNDDILDGGDGNDTIRGGDGDDILTDGRGTDTVEGGAGNDIFRLTVGNGDFTSAADSFDGGTGIDTFELSVNHAGTQVFDMEAGTYLLQGFTISVTNFENFDGTGQTAPAAQTVRGTSGDNTILMSSADDTVEGRGGADTLDGGAGIDTLSYESSDEGVRIDLAAGSGTFGHAEGDMFTGFENVLGSAFDDSLLGDGVDNVLRGEDGNDFLRGNAGNDTLIGGDGNDTFEGGTGTDTHEGGAGNDSFRVSGNLGSFDGEVFDGGTGADNIAVIGQFGDIDLTGASIVDVEAIIFSTNSGVVDSRVELVGSQFGGTGLGFDGIFDANELAGATNTIAIDLDGQSTFDLSDIQFVQWDADDLVVINGTSSGETITGTVFSDEINAGNGSDNVIASGGVDVVDLGGGVDFLRFNNGGGVPAAGTTFDGGASTDFVVVSASGTTDLRDVSITNFERLEFQAGNDVSRTVQVTATQLLGFDVVDGNEFSNGVDTLEIDVTSSAAAIDLSGLTFQDWGTGLGTQSDAVIIRDENDAAQTITGTSQDDTFIDDSNIGSVSLDTLIGGAGNDTFVHQNFAFQDNLDGGTGIDTADYSAESDIGAVINLATGSVAFAASFSSIANVENVIGSQLDDVITGDAESNVIDAKAGDDTIIDLHSAGITDNYDGGDGVDTLVATQIQWGPTVIFDLTEGNQRFGTGFSNIADTYANIENVTVNGAAQIRGDNADNVLTAITGPGAGGPGSFANIINGEGGNDTINAGDDDDVISGGFGNDALFGEDGDDILSGDGGNDTLDGGDGIDTASYANAGGRVAVFLNNAPSDLGSGQGIDTFVSIENVIGTDFDDRLVGDAANNVLSGGLGDDVLIGLAGDDTLNGENGDDELTGSGGNDTLNGGNGFDLLVGLGGADILNGGGGNDEIQAGLGVDTVNGGGGEDDIFGNFGADIIDGGADNDNIRAGGSGDTVNGGAGNDRLVGANGKDTLWGGAGNDTMFGGGGTGGGDGLRDTFVFKSAANGGGGFDRIKDFENNIDKIDLSESGYTNFADVFADATQVGADVQINFDFSGVSVIENFTLAQLNDGDFLF
ncbi:MAG: hypothetical protein ABJL99_14860 [Aliishimia sp.]